MNDCRTTSRYRASESILHDFLVRSRFRKIKDEQEDVLLIAINLPKCLTQWLVKKNVGLLFMPIDVARWQMASDSNHFAQESFLCTNDCKWVKVTAFQTDIQIHIDIQRVMNVFHVFNCTLETIDSNGFARSFLRIKRVKATVLQANIQQVVEISCFWLQIRNDWYVFVANMMPKVLSIMYVRIAELN